MALNYERILRQGGNVRIRLRARLQRKVTRTDLEYEGSLSLGLADLRLANLDIGEQIHVVNVTTGARFITYVILGEPDVVCVNGAAARLVEPGDVVIVMAYEIS